MESASTALTPTSSFTYDDPLRSSSLTHEIRLLYLQPGQRSSQLVCELRRVSLEDKPQYDALSYCWYGQQPSQAIICDGGQLLVTLNLYDALCRFRRLDEVVTLWTDAVCINQSDLEERNEQLPLMGRIYSEANEVKVWLGLANAETPTVVRLMSELRRMADACSEAHDLPLKDMFDLDSEEWAMAAADATDDIAKENWDPFIRFLENPYFARSWVIQEVTLSRGRARVYCGDDATWSWNDIVVASFFSFHSDVLAEVIVSGDSQTHVIAHRVAALARTTSLLMEDPEAGIDLIWLLYTNCASLASNPLDKVYAFLGLAKKDADTPDGQLIVPDYRLDAATVYQQVSELYLARYPKFRIITGAGPRDPHESQTPNLPSWVVDWNYQELGSLGRNPGLDEEYRLPTAGFDPSRTDVYPKVYSVEGKVLKISGVILDEIVEQGFLFASEKMQNSTKGMSWLQRGMWFLDGWKTVSKIWGLDSAATYPFTGEPMADAFLRTSSLNDIPESMTEDKRRRGLSGVMKIASLVALAEASPLSRAQSLRRLSLSLIARGTPWSYSQDVAEVMAMLVSNGSERLFFRTRKGYLGISLGLKWTQVGDRVVIARGCQAPWILRPLENDTWMYVGESYVHGAMEGEAFDIDKCVDISIV